MEFFCVYVKVRKKFDKFVKINKIRNKYIIDIKKIIEQEEIVDYDQEKTYLKILILQKIQQAVDKNKNIYYIPNFDSEFSIEKLLNIKKILGKTNNFNILIFYNEFRKDPQILDDVLSNMSKFSNSQIIYFLAIEENGTIHKSQSLSNIRIFLILIRFINRYNV